MKEVKCRLCGGETNQGDGVCRPCEMFRKDEVAVLIEKGAAIEKIKTLRESKPAKDKINGGAEMRKRNNKVCSKCNTEATSNREKTCHKCGEPFLKKGTAGREKKKRGRPTNYEKSQGRIATPAARNDRKGNGDYDGVILKLITAKSDYQQKVTEIENAIEALKKYAA